MCLGSNATDALVNFESHLIILTPIWLLRDYAISYDETSYAIVKPAHGRILNHTPGDQDTVKMPPGAVYSQRTSSLT